MKKMPTAYFAEEMMRIMPLLMKNINKKQSDALLRGKITIPQFLVLDIIDKQRRLKMKEIASYLNVSLPAATGLVDRLFIHGFVKRGASKKDRRIVNIGLTNKGKVLIKRLRHTRKKTIEDIFGKLTDKERADYLSILHKVMLILEAKKRKKK